MSKEYFIWCDESIKNGKHYSNFYGGVLIKSKNVPVVLSSLEAVVNELGIKEEIKWGKVDPVKLPAFFKLVDTFFDLHDKGLIKTRIMFRQSAKVSKNVPHENRAIEYFLLYYQFLKHAFGFMYSKHSKATFLRIHLDHLPDTKSKVEQFKAYIKGLERTKGFIDANLKIRKDDIVEIDSKKHLPLQFLDVILGAIQFRLNDMHLIKVSGTNRRGKKTIAKEKLYKHIYQRVCKLKPHFNIGISTGGNRWEMPYAHWSFIPKEFEIDESKYK